MTDVLFLILARAGSKGLPSKNILKLNKHPLLAYPIMQAEKSKLSHLTVLSTDSKAYAKIGIKYGAKAPFLRPKHLASDTAKSTDACLHALNWLEEHQGLKFKYLCLLEPTSPFTKIEWVEEAIKILDKKKNSSLVACRITSPHTYFIQDQSDSLKQLATKIKNLQNLNRQEFKKQITPSGNFYISKVDQFKKNKSFYNTDTLSYIVEDPYNLEIDRPIDFKWAEFLIQKKIIKTR